MICTRTCQGCSKYLSLSSKKKNPAQFLAVYIRIGKRLERIPCTYVVQHTHSVNGGKREGHNASQREGERRGKKEEGKTLFLKGFPDCGHNGGKSSQHKSHHFFFSKIPRCTCRWMDGWFFFLASVCFPLLFSPPSSSLSRCETSLAIKWSGRIFFFQLA